MCVHRCARLAVKPPTECMQSVTQAALAACSSSVRSLLAAHPRAGHAEHRAHPCKAILNRTRLPYGPPTNSRKAHAARWEAPCLCCSERCLVCLVSRREVGYAGFQPREHAVEHERVVREQLPAQHAPDAVHIQLCLLPRTEELRAQRPVTSAAPKRACKVRDQITVQVIFYAYYLVLIW